MFKKVFAGFILFLGLGSFSLEASQPGQPHFGRSVEKVMALPDFGDPRECWGIHREEIIADRVDSFVRNGAGATNQADCISWINELKKHLVQCDKLNLGTACRYINNETYSLNQFVTAGLDKMCLQHGLNQEARKRAAMVKEAFKVAAEGWPCIGMYDADKELLETIQQCIKNKDDAVFEGRCAYIERKCRELIIDVTNKNVGKRTIAEYLTFMSGEYAERVRMLRKAIASGQVEKRFRSGWVSDTSASLDRLPAEEKLYVTWAREAALREQTNSGHERLENDWEDKLGEQQERGAQGQISLDTIMRSAVGGIKKYQNFLFGALGTVAFAAIAAVIWFNVARTDRRQVIVWR